MKKILIFMLLFLLSTFSYSKQYVKVVDLLSLTFEEAENSLNEIIEKEKNNGSELLSLQIDDAVAYMIFDDRF